MNSQPAITASVGSEDDMRERGNSDECRRGVTSRRTPRVSAAPDEALRGRRLPGPKRKPPAGNCADSKKARGEFIDRPNWQGSGLEIAPPPVTLRHHYDPSIGVRAAPFFLSRICRSTAHWDTIQVWSSSSTPRPASPSGPWHVAADRSFVKTERTDHLPTTAALGGRTRAGEAMSRATYARAPARGPVGARGRHAYLEIGTGMMANPIAIPRPRITAAMMIATEMFPFLISAHSSMGVSQSKTRNKMARPKANDTAPTIPHPIAVK